MGGKRGIIPGTVVLRWEKSVTAMLSRVHLGSIKRKVIVFALLATLIPSLSMGWWSYRNNGRALTREVGEELSGLTSHAARSLDLWLRERLYDLRVFAGSTEVAANLQQLSGARGGARRERPLARLSDYVLSVRQRSVNYEELMILDASGAVVASSGEDGTPPTRETDWAERASANEAIIEPPYWDARAGTALLTVAHAVRAPDERVLGFVAARIDMAGVVETLSALAPAGERVELYAIDAGGTILASSREVAGAFRATRLPDEAHRLLLSENGPLHYAGFRGEDVVGWLQPMQRTGWGVVAETPEGLAFASVRRMRNTTLALLSAILLAVGLSAYALGLTLVRPLHRLTGGAAAVAAGDLLVEVPVVGGGELSSLIRMFNQMVAGLREARTELDAKNDALRQKNRKLHELSITDGLTGVFNRGYLNRILANELTRSLRHGNPFGVLMIDIDNFKQFNDTRGHQAGDEILVEVTAALRDTVRNCDYVARYGGEEFIVLLTETDVDESERTAERLRESVEQRFAGDDARGPITISVGVAAFPGNGDEAESLLRAADVAMYQAKRAGRNRVSVAPADAGRSDRQAAG